MDSDCSNQIITESSESIWHKDRILHFRSFQHGDLHNPLCKFTFHAGSRWHWLIPNICVRFLCRNEVCTRYHTRGIWCQKQVTCAWQCGHLVLTGISRNCCTTVVTTVGCVTTTVWPGWPEKLTTGFLHLFDNFSVVFQFFSFDSGLIDRLPEWNTGSEDLRLCKCYVFCPDSCRKWACPYRPSEKCLPEKSPVLCVIKYDRTQKVWFEYCFDTVVPTNNNGNKKRSMWQKTVTTISNKHKTWKLKFLQVKLLPLSSIKMKWKSFAIVRYFQIKSTKCNGLSVKHNGIPPFCCLSRTEQLTLLINRTIPFQFLDLVNKMKGNSSPRIMQLIHTTHQLLKQNGAQNFNSESVRRCHGCTVCWSQKEHVCQLVNCNA